MPCRLSRPPAALLLIALALPTGRAAAQVALPVTSTEQIATCLCLERSINQLAQEVTAQSRLYDEKKRALESLDQEVTTQRPRVDVNDRGAIEAFRQLLDRRDAAQMEFANQVTPRYATTVETHNRQVAQYNSQCARQSFSSEVVASVRANLVCPAQ